jgi:polyphosphate glucokinase
MKVAAGGRRRVKGVLVIDVGGTSVKILASGQPQSRSFRSGPKLTPRRMVSEVKKLAADWTYDVVSIGYPGRTQGITTLASVNSRNRELRWTHPVFII